MKLVLHPNSRKARVRLQHIVDYEAFKSRFGRDPRESELHLLEKYYATHSLVEEGYPETFVESTLVCVPRLSDDVNNLVTADVCGKSDDELTVVFCETTRPTSQLYRNLNIVAKANNAKAILLYPFSIDSTIIGEKFQDAMASEKFVIKRVSWLNSGLEETFKEAIDLLDLLSNETRVRMLLRLLDSPCEKKHYRAEINPKLVYENLASFLTHGLVHENPDKLYELSPFGGRLLAEYLTFLEKVKKALEEE
jgi:hypothetical protein